MKKICLFLLLTIPLFVLSQKLVFSQPCNNTDECTRLIDEYSQQITKLQGQANTLKNQISQFDAQIKLATVKIAQTEAQINLLGGRIVQVGESVNNLTQAFNQRVVETYKISRFENNFSFVLSADDLSNAFSKTQYLKKIQDEDKRLIDKLIGAKNTYEFEKRDQEELQKTLEKQKSSLNSQKLAKNALLTLTKNDETRYQSLLSQAKAQLSAFRSFVSSQGGATILQNQTKCDGWGCYYNQRDSQWGNIGLGGSSYSMASYGCLVSSVSMVASHFGKNIKPGDIAVNTSAFVPATGYLYWSFSVAGVNISIASTSKSNLDSELAKGRPVIAGLYGGPDHFIVILRKEGDKYIMHDPFLENGSNRPLTDKYKVSDISSLRLVNFN